MCGFVSKALCRRRKPDLCPGSHWGSLDDRDVYIDSRLIDRMPEQLRFIQRGIGPFRRLDLDFSGEKWGRAVPRRALTRS
jgi:hypothetical protein